MGFGIAKKERAHSIVSAGPHSETTSKRRKARKEKKSKKDKDKDKDKKKKGKSKKHKKKKKERNDDSSSSDSSGDTSEISSDWSLNDANVDYGSAHRISENSDQWDGRSAELYLSDSPPDYPLNAYHLGSRPRILVLEDFDETGDIVQL